MAFLHSRLVRNGPMVKGTFLYNLPVVANPRSDKNGRTLFRAELRKAPARKRVASIWRTFDAAVPRNGGDHEL